VVIGQLDPQTTRSTRDVFRQYSEDFEFVRTRPVVKLFGLGLRFVSRSEARRLLTGLDEFTEIDLDFAGVEDVGQGFVDELLRVWPQENPGKTINPLNMNEAVEFMVRRVPSCLARRRERDGVTMFASCSPTCHRLPLPRQSGPHLTACGRSTHGYWRTRCHNELVSRWPRSR
jgi:uncharacterized protein DUF4325